MLFFESLDIGTQVGSGRLWAFKSVILCVGERAAVIICVVDDGVWGRENFVRLTTAQYVNIMAWAWEDGGHLFVLNFMVKLWIIYRNFFNSDIPIATLDFGPFNVLTLVHGTLYRCLDRSRPFIFLFQDDNLLVIALFELVHLLLLALREVVIQGRAPSSGAFLCAKKKITCHIVKSSSRWHSAVIIIGLLVVVLRLILIVRCSSIETVLYRIYNGHLLCSVALLIGLVSRALVRPGYALCLVILANSLSECPFLVRLFL